MNSLDSQTGKQEETASCDEEIRNRKNSFCSPYVLNTKIRSFTSCFSNIRHSIVDSDLFSVWLFLLAMPTLGIMIQCFLFFFGITCSAFPMWFSFLFFSALSLLIHWKKLLLFWTLVVLALLFTSFTFSYMDYDAEVYHTPMQLLLREGWNPVFDSSLQKFAAIVKTSSLSVYHTLFLPKTAALCGALVARSTGLWIADSFLGYVLLFVLFRTAFVFAKQQWNCNCFSGLFFALAIALNSKITLVMDGGTNVLGRVDYHTYSALMIAVLSLIMYLRQHSIHDFVLAVMATAICSTVKTTGLVNCVFLWLFFGLVSWKKKETYIGIGAVTLMVAWIGMSPLITAWIQYGSPFYPAMTFDPKITLVDITDDFCSNADGERMGYLARFVYAWISPALANKACALFYHQESFNPCFFVKGGVGGLKSLNSLICTCVFLLLLAKKDFVTFFSFYIILTLFLCPLKYIGYARYFPQIWALIPIAFYQFAYIPPDFLRKKNLLMKLSRYSLLSLFCLLCCFSSISLFAFQIRSMIREGIRQNLLADFRNQGSVFLLPPNSKRGFTLSRRLSCVGIDYEFSQYNMDIEHFDEDTSFPHYKQYYLSFRRFETDYPICKSPSSFIHFRWLDFFKYFPHPLFYSKPDTSDSSASENATLEKQDQTS